METLVEIRDVRKVYKRDEFDVPVLNGITLDVPRGDFLALMGPSGSGKTTLLNLIAGIDRPTSGRLPLLLTKLSKKERREHVTAALNIVGLSDRIFHYPRQLSGGQEQRVAIARAVVTDPSILVADEPTGDLDARNAQETLDLLQRLNEEFDKTIMMVTHDPKAAQHARRTMHLEKGLLVEMQEMAAAQA